MNKKKLYISTMASSKETIKEAIVDLTQHGFTDIELTSSTKFYEGIEKDLFILKNVHGLDFIIHNYFPPAKNSFVMNIVSKDSREINDTFMAISNAIRLTTKMGGDTYTVHPGFNVSGLTEVNGEFYGKSEIAENPAFRRENLYEAIDTILSLGAVKDNDIRIGIENLFDSRKSNIRACMVADKDIIDFLEHYRLNPMIGLLLDLGHLNIVSAQLGFDRDAFIERLFSEYPDKIFEIHVSDNNADFDAHAIPGPASWQVQAIARHMAALADTFLVMEWRGPLDDNTVRGFAGIKEGLGL